MIKQFFYIKYFKRFNKFYPIYYRKNNIVHLLSCAFLIKNLLIKHSALNFFLPNHLDYNNNYLYLLSSDMALTHLLNHYSKKNIKKKVTLLKKQFKLLAKKKPATNLADLHRSRLKTKKLVKPFWLISPEHISMLPGKKKRRYLKITSSLKLNSKLDNISIYNNFFTKITKGTFRGGKYKSSFTKWLRAVIKQKGKLSFYEFLSKLLQKSYPRFFLKKYSLGRRVVSIPLPIISQKKTIRAAKWLKKAQSKRPEKTNLFYKLEKELKATMLGTGNIKKFHKELEKQVFETKSNVRFLRMRRRKRV